MNFQSQCDKYGDNSLKRKTSLKQLWIVVNRAECICGQIQLRERKKVVWICMYKLNSLWLGDFSGLRLWVYMIHTIKYGRSWLSHKIKIPICMCLLQPFFHRSWIQTSFLYYIVNNFLLGFTYRGAMKPGVSISRNSGAYWLKRET